MTTTPDPRDEPLRPAADAPTRPSSPGPDPDDINPDDPAHGARRTDAASGAPGAANPTSPGPNPDDVAP
ncbi:hypothetical protein MHY85_14420 [Cellulomonas sp. ACRRI]|uniref:hypothetical protein n=1 Tax=Cellulomonas sp. ACRRI TaxID=2918188 RepID=UPI001EF209C6|nr:hypothetical protein [Cellulomonas sp. ACRRI]MCG7287161.1 hypothetical protein [Cellulomonas sp. ACRRI]